MNDLEVAARRAYATKSDLAYDWLQGAILRGEYPPGAALNQVVLAKAIGISTTPLREALKRLSAEGLVVFESHRDARVSKLSVEESRDLLELRLSLDPLAVGLAAERRSREDIAQVRTAFEEMEAGGSPDAAIDSDAHFRFHRALYCASHNELLISTLDSLWAKAERYRLLGLSAVRYDAGTIASKRREKHEDHSELVLAVVSGDADRASSVMTRHIRKSLDAQAATFLLSDSDESRPSGGGGPAMMQPLKDSLTRRN